MRSRNSPLVIQTLNATSALIGINPSTADGLAIKGYFPRFQNACKIDRNAAQRIK